jgi:hypothetical protein
MSIFQFVWQVIALCAIAVLLVFGLFSAPWYVLGGILLIALVLTWKLMPNQETWVSTTEDPGKLLHSSPLLESSEKPVSGQTPNMLYRGAQYPTVASKGTAAAPPQAILSYRGATYAPKPKVAPPNSPSSSEPSQSPELKYRGAKTQSSSNPPA